MLYATASRGFKSGGFDEFAFPSRSYNPEYVWNYEVGVKAKAFDNRLTANLTGFMMNYSNLQQTITGLDPGDITFRTVNASTGKIKGVELELEAYPVDSLHLTASGAYLDTKYEGLRSADPIYPELGIRDLSGNQIAGASKWQFNVGGDYTVPIGGLLGTLKASYSWNSKTPLDIYSNPGFEQDSVGVLNASASLSTEDKAWEVTAFAQNLTNELYVTNVQAQNVGGGGFQRGTSFGDVRRYGIRVGHRF